MRGGGGGAAAAGGGGGGGARKVCGKKAQQNTRKEKERRCQLDAHALVGDCAGEPVELAPRHAHDMISIGRPHICLHNIVPVCSPQLAPKLAPAPRVCESFRWPEKSINQSIMKSELIVSFWVRDVFCTQHLKYLKVLGAKHISTHDFGTILNKGGDVIIIIIIMM